jgi:hypothetical protein
MMIGLDNGTRMKHCIFLISSQRLGRSSTRRLYNMAESMSHFVKGSQVSHGVTFPCCISHLA